MKFLITGADGQLGRGWQRSLESQPTDEFIALNRQKLDICNPECIRKVLTEYKPDVCINTAAYTYVDNAEKEHDLAYRANVLGPKLLAEICAQRGIQLVHYSTDYVFSGKLSDREIYKDGYPEEAPTDPINQYGASKLEGEKAVVSALPSALIARVSWLCGLDGDNFVKSIIHRAKSSGQLQVVNDQFGIPCFVPYIIEQTRFLLHSRTSGLYHLGSKGCITWYDFANKIIEDAQLNVNVEAVDCSALSTQAQRPYFSKLSTSKLEATGMSVPSWEIGCKTLVSDLIKV
mgnify:CR=1 FL=1|tara:strand:+ start:6331 stop:7197 length:867 start_codon:yes stop_codon:yes gene_type:complete